MMDPIKPRDVLRSFQDSDAVAMRMSAEAQRARPADQPQGADAKLTGSDWVLSNAGGVQLENLGALFADGLCPTCLIPRGERTRRRLKVRYEDALSRRCAGVVAHLADRPRGPSYHLYTTRFLTALGPGARRMLRWRAVDIVNPTKTTQDLFEIVSSKIHAQVVALRGGSPDVLSCSECGRSDSPSYPLAGQLPTWLNHDDIRWRGQPGTYVAAASLPDPSPDLYTLGDWQRGVSIAVSESLWTNVDRRARMGISPWPVGQVGPHLIEANSAI